MAYVFGYGSLLHPGSLHRTLPRVDLLACIPVTVRRFVRTFDVAFPNDDSQPDKVYYDGDGARPGQVLLANLRRSLAEGWVNGVCIPVDAEELAALRQRELRYLETDLTGLVRPYPPWQAPIGPVLTFTGREEFTGAEAAAGGVLSRAYLETISDGAAYWDHRVRGFSADFEASTRAVPAVRVQALRRVDVQPRDVGVQPLRRGNRASPPPNLA